MPTPRTTIQDIVSTSIERMARQQRNRGSTLFQLLRPATDFGTSPLRPIFVRRRSHTPWKVFRIKKVTPAGDGKKSRVWADVYFGGVLKKTDKKMSGVNKRGVWTLVTPKYINTLEEIYLKETKDEEKWERIVMQDDAALKKGSQSLWEQVKDETDDKLSNVHQRQKALLKLMRARYEDATRHKHLRETSKKAEVSEQV